MRALPLLFIALALPAYAQEQAVPDANALVITHSEDEVANNPGVVAAKQQVGTAVAASVNAKNQDRALNEQIRGANEKYMQDSRNLPQNIGDFEAYTQGLQNQQQHFDTLHSQLRTGGSTSVDARKAAEIARQNMRLKIFEARIDNAAFPVFIAEGTTWYDNAGRNEQRMLLRDTAGKRYTLNAPQRFDQLNNSTCTYMPVRGEIWAMRGAELIAPDAKAPKNELPVLKIASLNQVYLLEHAAKASCPFGHVFIKTP